MWLGGDLKFQGLGLRVWGSGRGCKQRSGSPAPQPPNCTPQISKTKLMTAAISAFVGLAAYSQVDKLGVWFKSVKFGAKTAVGGEALIQHEGPNLVLSCRLELRLPNHFPHPPGRRTESAPQPQPRGYPVPFLATLSMVRDSPGQRARGALLLSGAAGRSSLSDVLLEHLHRRVGARWRESRCFSTGPHCRPRQTFLLLPCQPVSSRKGLGTQIPFIDAPWSGAKGGA